jgi:hypothetical protein
MLYRYFQTNSNGHSKSNSYLLALLSYYIYEDEVPGSGANFRDKFISTFNALAPPAEQFNITVETNLTEYAVLSTSNLILVCFRGSDEASDWISAIPGGNFSSEMITAPPSWGSVKVHANYYQALNMVYGQVLSSINNRLRRGTRVFITGHSRGGSLATLCAYRLKQIDKIDVAGLYTFGAPRVGNDHFRSLYRNAGLWDKTFRWVRDRDMGPRWPDFDTVVGTNRYYHVGEMFHISGSGVVTNPDPDFEPTPDVYIDSFTAGGDHDMFIYCTLMYLRLSNDERQNMDSPTWLVKQDIPNGLPHLSSGML